MKIKKQQINFTQVSNEVLNNKNLSAKAKGIYSYIFSKPDNWDFSIERVSEDFTDGYKSLSSGIKELEALGYLRREKQSNGRNVYSIYQESQGEAQTPKTAGSQKGRQPKRQVDETATISNKDNINNKEDINNTDTTSSNESSDSKGTEVAVVEEDKRNPDVQDIIDTMVSHHGVVDGKIQENRRYAYLLSEKIKKIPGFEENFRSVGDFVDRIIKETSQYHIQKTASPKKMYYELGGLISMIRAKNKTDNTPKKKVKYG